MQELHSASVNILSPAKDAQGTGSSGSDSNVKRGRNIRVTGKLERAMGIGGESSGWTIALDPKVKIDGKLAETVEVQSTKETLEPLAGQQVVARGVIVHKTGVERGPWPVLDIKKISKAKASATTPLEGTHWMLVDVDGKPASTEGRKAELTMTASSKKVAGSGGCNRLMGGYESSESSLRFTQVASTRMACAEPAMEQEKAFLDALNSTTSYRITGTKLELLKNQQVLASFEKQGAH
jgi:heat shock protein HslJ